MSYTLNMIWRYKPCIIARDLSHIKGDRLPHRFSSLAYFGYFKIDESNRTFHLLTKYPKTLRTQFPSPIIQKFQSQEGVWIRLQKGSQSMRRVSPSIRILKVIHHQQPLPYRYLPFFQIRSMATEISDKLSINATYRMKSGHDLPVLGYGVSILLEISQWPNVSYQLYRYIKRRYFSQS